MMGICGLGEAPDAVNISIQVLEKGSEWMHPHVLISSQLLPTSPQCYQSFGRITCMPYRCYTRPALRLCLSHLVPSSHPSVLSWWISNWPGEVRDNFSLFSLSFSPASAGRDMPTRVVRGQEPGLG